MSETTQRYKEDSTKRNISKKILCEFLDFLKQKVVNDELTADEVTSIVHSVVDNTEIYATADELARFYGKTKQGVYRVINRRMIEKPQRRVYYSFKKFREIIPKDWLEKTPTKDIDS